MVSFAMTVGTDDIALGDLGQEPIERYFAPNRIWNLEQLVASVIKVHHVWRVLHAAVRARNVLEFRYQFSATLASDAPVDHDSGLVRFLVLLVPPTHVLFAIHAISVADGAGEGSRTL
jgi:hypothetical protein